MIQSPSAVLSHQLSLTLRQILGTFIFEEDLAQSIRQVEFLYPTSSKNFWHSNSAAAGLYIVLTGKARILDCHENLVVSIGPQETFGEITLFPDEGFHPYKVRASLSLQIGVLPETFVRYLMQKYPALQEKLRTQAVQQDLLLFCRQSLLLRYADSEALKKLVSQLEPHTLSPGSLPIPLYDAQSLWLIRQGELRSRSAFEGPEVRFQTGQLILLSEVPVVRDLQASQPTELYSLSDLARDLLVQKFPLLASLLTSWGKTQNGEAISRIHRPLPQSLEPITGFARQKDAIAKPVLQVSRQPSRRQYFPNPTTRLSQIWRRVARQYPFFAQQSATDCGAACLAMVGRYWGKRFSINRLRDLANVNRSGSSLRFLADAAESIGFIARPVKASLDKLAEQSLPAIAHWEGKHYVVVYAITPKRVMIADPAIGQRSLTHAAFKQGWTGYTLLLEPTILLKTAQEANPAFWQFFELIKPHSLVLFEVLAASLLIQVFGLVTPLLTQLLLDRVVVQGSDLTLNAVGFALLIFGIFKIATTGLRQYLLDHTANKIDLSLIVGFIQHTFRLPMQFFESRYVGDIMSRVQENYKIRQFLTGEALSILLDLTTVFVYLGLMFWYSWRLALLVLVVVPPFFLLALVATPFLRRISKEIFNGMAAENSYLIEALTGIRSIRSMALEQTVRWHWEGLLSQFIRSTFSGQLVSNRLRICSSVIESFAITFLLWFGAGQVIQNQLSVGQLVAFYMLLGNVITPFQRMIVLWNQLQEVVIAVERINDVLDAEPEEDLQQQPRQILPMLQGSIRFEQVTFRYHASSDINTLENLSFEVHPGQTVALVGRSGSGKTTVSKLVLGLYPPTTGRILMDGQDITTLSLRSLRQQIGVVDQDTFLFGGTIRDNISIAHPEATLSEVMKAAEQAGADQFIRQLPLGYETLVGEGGGLLSGGQRQRLAIARALLGQPRLLILDEATSHLDAESERIIQQNFATILQNRTTLVIAHRLSTICNADLILVLDRGVLIEQGTHAELMKKHGHYFYLNQQQFAIAS
ncbi:MAG: peptidase domain-containing ABC transporter [Thermosynechococcaceae cyanobacterium MS004]|nr:peptidase domain-containing ABC transporter [Thermosynechococcaceae cyanobacterium MS004]